MSITQSSGAISASDIQSAYGDTGSFPLGSFYRNGGSWTGNWVYTGTYNYAVVETRYNTTGTKNYVTLMPFGNSPRYYKFWWGGSVIGEVDSANVSSNNAAILSSGGYYYTQYQYQTSYLGWSYYRIHQNVITSGVPASGAISYSDMYSTGNYYGYYAT